MKYWIYYILAFLLLLHPHLKQKILMLRDYLLNPQYQFWTTFNAMDLLDLILHAGIPIVLVILGIRKQRHEKKGE